MAIAATIIFAFSLVFPFADFLFPGQDKAGKGMITGLFVFGLWLMAVILALIAFIRSFKDNGGRSAKIFARLPLIFIVTLIAFGLISAIYFG